MIEDLKQRISARAHKIKQYNDRILQFQQNQLFEVNQRQFYKELDDPRGSDQTIPDANEAREFWSNIWDRPVEHRRDAGWLNDLKGKTLVEQQDDLTIDIEKLRAILRKIPNWKASGPDNVQGFWLKSMKKLHQWMALQLQECLDGRGSPEWMTMGRTVLLINDMAEGNAVGNYNMFTNVESIHRDHRGGFLPISLPEVIVSR